MLELFLHAERLKCVLGHSSNSMLCIMSSSGKVVIAHSLHMGFQNLGYRFLFHTIMGLCPEREIDIWGLIYFAA